MDSDLDYSQWEQGDSAHDDDNEHRIANVDSAVHSLAHSGVGNTAQPKDGLLLSDGESREIPQTALSDDTNATPPPSSKRKKKDGKGSSFESINSCRFCKKEFTSHQALGGHMNIHKEERSKEEIQKAEILVHTKRQKFSPGYPCGGATSYYQPRDNYGNYYQGGGIQMANASVMGNMGGGGLQRQVYQSSNQQFVVAPQMNPIYENHQKMAQANYQPQPQHGGSYVNYNQCDNAPRPHIPGEVPQTSYTPRANSGQYQDQGTGSLQDVRPYAMPSGGSSTGVAYHQSNKGFTCHNLSQAGGGSSMPTLDNISTLGTPAAGSNSNAGTAQFVDQFGNIKIQGPSSGYSTGLRSLNPSHFHNNIQAATEYNQGPPQDHYTSQASYAGTSIHGTIQVQSDQYNAAVGMEYTSNQYHALGEGMFNFGDAHEGDEFANGSPDLSTTAVTESGHGSGASTGTSADARSHL